MKFKTLITVSLCALLFSSCLTGRKLDHFVAEYYGNNLPAPERKKSTDITISSVVSGKTGDISISEAKTSHMLPLVFYWQWTYDVNCILNPAIAVSYFNKAVNQQTGMISQKLKGQKLELTIEQLPLGFTMDDKARMVWIIYAVGWDIIKVQPEGADLIVSYKLLKADGAVKTGKLTVKNNERSQGLRFWQSWRSATREYLARYQDNVNTMTKTMVKEILDASE